MHLKYRDGTEFDDGLFDLDVATQRQIMAAEMGLNPNTPYTWPVGTLDKLLGIRRLDGVLPFHAELQRMFRK